VPSVEENLFAWTNYNWSEQGDEWSQDWGGTDFLWWRTIYPRIRKFIPTGTILEIAPGYGRCTQFLHRFCKELIIVDLTEKCIDSCRERFKSESHIKYYVNDGKSLDMIPDDSIDFVFSWDSLVHAENDVLESYIRQLSKKLKGNGFGFIHHSNLGSHVNKQNAELSALNQGWRGATMSAELFHEYCENNSMHCIAQEKVNWLCSALIDCMSLFSKAHVRQNIVVENTCFSSGEADYSRYLSNIYSVTPISQLPQQPICGSIAQPYASPQEPVGDKVATLPGLSQDSKITPHRKSIKLHVSIR